MFRANGYMSNGIVILDTGCYKYLEDPAVRDRLIRDLSISAWEPWPSTINALEIAKTGSPVIRHRLKSTLRALFPDAELLPWPHVLLDRIAQAVHRGRPRAHAGDSHFDWLLAEDSDISPDDLERAHAFLDGQVASFEDMLVDRRFSAS